MYMRRLFLAVATNHLPDACSKSSTCKWSNDEHPKVGESLTALEDCRTDGTSRIDRSACVVNTHEVDEHQRETNGKTGKVARTFLSIGCAKHYKHEDTSENCLGNETYHHAMITTTVSTCECATSQSLIGRSERIENSRTNDGTNHLENHIEGCILTADTLRDEAAKCDGWVDVATRNATDGVSHCHYSKAESKCCTDNRCCINTTIERNSCSASKECKNHCSHHFC